MNVTGKPSRLRRGSIVVLAAVFMIFVLGMAAFTTDFGYMQVSKTRLRAAVDAAALAAIDDLTNDEAAMTQTINELLLANGYDTTNSDLVVTTEYGNWDVDNLSFHCRFRICNGRLDSTEHCRQRNPRVLWSGFRRGRLLDRS
jgi:uncharacterized membrane protein